MSSNYDVEMTTDDTLELDTIIQEWSNPDNIIDISPDSNNYSIDGFKTKTGVFDPDEPDVYTIDINGQSIKVNVIDNNFIPDSYSYSITDNEGYDTNNLGDFETDIYLYYSNRTNGVNYVNFTIDDVVIRYNKVSDTEIANDFANNIKQSNVDHRWYLNDVDTSTVGNLNDKIGSLYGTRSGSDIQNASGNYRFGSAVKNTGSGYVRFNNSNKIGSNTGTNFTISLTVDNLTNSDAFILGTSSFSSAETAIQLYLENDKLKFQRQDNKSNDGRFHIAKTDNKVNISDGKKHRILVTVGSNKNNITIYVD